MLQQFKIIEKKNLTNDVYEIVFEWETELEMKPWQFVTFLLPEIGWRAYSILEQNWNKIVLIIKKRELENGWRWGSKYICERKVWEELKTVGPAGHFVLQENTKNKLFYEFDNAGGTNVFCNFELQKTFFRSSHFLWRFNYFFVFYFWKVLSSFGLSLDLSWVVTSCTRPVAVPFFTRCLSLTPLIPSSLP